jgi:hypothetical protein
MVLAVALLGQFATAAGLMAAGIAVGGFVFHAGPALEGSAEDELRQTTVVGGLIGLSAAVFLIVLSALIG